LSEAHTEERRARALLIAGIVVASAELDPPGDPGDLEEITIEMADRFTYWLATGRKRAKDG
jgi:hypothetical protein